MFKLYVQFLGDAGLLGKTTIAVDGSKFKAVNSRKSNYNQKKIDKHRQFIAEKIAKYLQELDELDKQENSNADDLTIKKEKIAQGMAKLKERTIKYDTLQQQLDNTTDKQISTTDPDSRSIIIVKNIVEVAYNVQNAVDDKHNLIVHTQATNTNDGKALHKTAMQAKHNLQLQKEDPLMLLADKGYHTEAEILQCQQENFITHVAFKEQPGVKHIAHEFLVESFRSCKLYIIFCNSYRRQVMVLCPLYYLLMCFCNSTFWIDFINKAIPKLKGNYFLFNQLFFKQLEPVFSVC